MIKNERQYKITKAEADRFAAALDDAPAMRQGIDKAAVRLESSGDFPQAELSSWLKDSWAIDLPQSDYGVLGKAIAQLENTEALLSVQKVSIRAIPDVPQYQQVALSVQTVLLKK